MYRMIIYNIFIIKTPKNTFFILVSRIYISAHNLKLFFSIFLLNFTVFSFSYCINYLSKQKGNLKTWEVFVEFKNSNGWLNLGKETNYMKIILMPREPFLFKNSIIVCYNLRFLLNPNSFHIYFYLLFLLLILVINLINIKK